MTNLPSIPDIPAGTVAGSAEMNELASACSFLLGSASGTNPFWWLTQTTGQSIGTSATAVNWASPTKDNDGVWASANPSRATIQTPGFYSIDWDVAFPAGGNAFAVQAYAQVTTTASNPYNPSASIKFQFSSLSVVSTSGSLISHGGGLVPTWLNTGDYIQILAMCTAAETTITVPPSCFHGELVSE